MPADLTLAAIIEEVRRQDANFQTVILKTGHALRLVAVAEAAVKMHRWANWGETFPLCRACASHRDKGHTSECPVGRFAAAASAGEGKTNE